ncbi:hypothetical protein BC939DRAFT_495704 [Gamsiella multidivaricata]|uniref:uncharacterized protein n=1 Tax=Gamsiella multidivaricata TaxID=101098 RepID=UPI00221FCABB|nr:uncharacterized protein BC939DRAFT_495704 [Gamsiella multidivaricata]KAI7818804.1 hypothetical protein BC939DRAFT_495704 [Gamsiella multidivaricata]
MEAPSVSQETYTLRKLINIGDVDAFGKCTGAFKTYTLSGYVRVQSESDDNLNCLGCKSQLPVPIAYYVCCYTCAFDSRCSDTIAFAVESILGPGTATDRH